MITLRKAGHYQLIETKHHNKILYLDKNSYAWIETAHIGEILVYTHKLHKTDCILSVGRYRLYEVEDEPNFFDLQHLELETGPHRWQGYLLLSGLPTSQHKTARITPTQEIVAGRKVALPTQRLTLGTV